MLVSIFAFCAICSKNGAAAGDNNALKSSIEQVSCSNAAVKAAFEGETGKMVILKRVSDDPYLCVTDIYDVHKIANVEKKVPREWINEAGDYVTDEFLDYVRPLIQAELTPMMVDGLPRHLRLEDIAYKK